MGRLRGNWHHLLLILIIAVMASARWSMKIAEPPRTTPLSSGPAAVGSSMDGGAGEQKSSAISADGGVNSARNSHQDNTESQLELNENKNALLESEAAGITSQGAPNKGFKEKLLAECSQANFESCEQIGEFLVNNGNRDEGIRVLEKACDESLDSVEICASVGGLLSSEQLNRAKNLCSDGNAKACIKMAGSLPDEKSAEAKSYAQRACSLGLESACALVGELINQSESTQISASCDAGDAKACMTMAGFLSKSKRESEAAQFVSKACNQGMASSCLDWGENATQQAVAPLEKECDNKVSSACLKVAGFLVKSGDEKKAESLVEQSCNRGDSGACKILAHIRKKN
jgi:hypothetical protein